MIPEQFTTRFNPNFTVPHSRVKHLLITIRELGGSNTDTTTKSENTPTIDATMMEAGRKMMRELAEAKDSLITELVALAYSLSNEEKENLDFQVREAMYAEIAKARPSLIDFLSLSSPQSLTKMENVNNTESLVETYSVT